MDRKIGKILSCLFFFFATLSATAPNLNLRVTDTNGKVMQEAVLGVPFLLEVIVKGDEKDIQSINVSGLNQFHAQNYGTMSSITQMNNATSIKKTYRYKLRSNRLGSFTLGPAYAATAQGMIRSEPVSIKVVEEKQNDKKKSEIKLKLLTDKKWVVVGERIPVTIRLYADPEYKLHGLYPSQSQLKSEMGSIVGPYMGSEKIDGASVSYREWHTEVISQEQGTLIVPAFKVDYAYQKKQHGDPFDIMVNFGDLFGTRYEYQHVYSNPLIVTVDPLPAHKDAIKAIGTFTQLAARVDHESAREGDGIVYMLELQGDGNWNAISYPPLLMPEALKHYESKSTKRESKKRITIAKQFEYIIQGLKPGTWEIPSQQFTYFDTAERRYKTLESNPVSVTITPFAQQSDASKAEAAQNADEQQDEEAVFLFSEWPQPVRSLPWSWFFLFSSMPVLYCLYILLTSRWQEYKRHNDVVLKKKYALKRARKELKRASKKGDLKLVYDAFMHLFADRCSRNPADITIESIVQILHEASVDRETIDQWHIFFNQVSEIIFFNKAVDQHKKEALLAGAQHWLDRLGGVL